MTVEEFTEFAKVKKPTNIHTGGDPSDGIVITFDDGTLIDVSPSRDEDGPYLVFTALHP